MLTNEFGRLIEPRTLSDYYHGILKAADLPHFTFHALRHTFAPRALEQGMDAKTLSTLLGHYSVAFTLDTYTHVLDDQKRSEMARMEALFQIYNQMTEKSYEFIRSAHKISHFGVHTGKLP